MNNDQPKYTVEAEQAVLGGLLLQNDKWDEISPLITEKDFYNVVHRTIFREIRLMLEQNKSVDLLILERVLGEKKLLEDCGGLAYLAELSKNTFSVANILVYAEIIKRDAQARALFVLGNELRSDAIKIQSQENLDNLINKAEKQLTDLTLNHQQDETVSVSSVLKEVLLQIEASSQNHSLVTGVPYGIERLDRNTAGGQRGELIVLAARPSMGKTALSLKFVEGALESICRKKQMLASQGLELEPNTPKTVQYFSLEMPRTQIVQRLLSMRARISSQKFRQAITMDDDDWGRLGMAMSELDNNWNEHLLIDDSSYLTPQLLRTRVRRNARQYGRPAVIIVDYLQLMNDPEYKNSTSRHLEIGSISRSLKALAKEMDCPVIALSQLNRGVEGRADKRPLNSDLRESGSIEQDADVIMFIYRDEVYHADTEMKGIAELIISKQRNGPIGTVFSRFQGEFSLFEDIPDSEYKAFERY